MDTSEDTSMLAMIVAVAENGVIGRAGGLPWRLSADLRRFKKLTMGHHVIMGRRTYESLPGPLPGRHLVVLTRQGFEAPPSIQQAPSLPAAIAACGTDPLPFVIGGESVFAEALPQVDILYLTVVHANPPGDTFWRGVNWQEWRLTEDSWYAADDRNEFSYSFRCYRRKRKPATASNCLQTAERLVGNDYC